MDTTPRYKKIFCAVHQKWEVGRGTICCREGLSQWQKDWNDLERRQSYLAPKLSTSDLHISGDCVIIADLHIHGFNFNLFKTVLADAKRRRIKQLAIIGDWFDMGSFSYWDLKGKADFEEEKEISRTLKVDQPLSRETKNELERINKEARKCVLCRKKIFNAFSEN